MKVIDILKYKKEIKKIKHENEDLKLRIKLLGENLVMDQKVVIIPTYIFTEMWDDLSHPAIIYENLPTRRKRNVKD